MAACRSPGSPAPTNEPAQLRGVSARCTSIRGEPAPEEPPLTLVFDTEARFSGHTGLNSYAGVYERPKDPAIGFRRIGSTRSAGPTEWMLMETKFLAALGEVDEFRLGGSNLELLKDGQVLLAFVPLAADGFTGAEKQRLFHSDDWPPNTAPDAEWVKMNSGEWLKGEILALTKGTLEFDSDELDELSLSYEDIAEIHTKRKFTVVFDDENLSAFADKPQAIGQVDVEGNTVFVATEDGTRRFEREQLYLMVPGVPKESNYWSGKVLLGVAVRSGNTEQTDVTASAEIKRRTANSRIEAKFDSVYGQQSDIEIANNQRLVGAYDVFLSRRFFVTPFGLELFRDRLKNIELQASPYAGVGYTLFDRPKYEHDVTFAVGYRSTKFDSVAEDGVDRAETAQVIPATTFSADLTAKIELEGSYSAQVSVQDPEDTNQNAFVGLSFDFWKDFDVDFRVKWNRVGRPEEDDSGNTPEKDDLRLDVGLSWAF